MRLRGRGACLSCGIAVNGRASTLAFRPVRPAVIAGKGRLFRPEPAMRPPYCNGRSLGSNWMMVIQSAVSAGFRSFSISTVTW